jgi:hypothetical protein
MSNPDAVLASRQELRRTFSYAGWTTAVSTNDPDTLHWLAEFLSPWVTVGEDHSCDYRIDFHVDRQEYDRLRGAAGTSPVRHAESFVRDGQVVLAPVWHESQGVETMVAEDMRVVYRLARSAREARILARAGLGRPRAALLRAVRELFLIAHRARGALLIHGAAIAVRDRVVILAGPRQTGKTTLLLHLLSALQARLVANDRVFVWPDTNDVEARGVPTIVSLRPGTLEMLPGLADRLGASGFVWSLARAEVGPPPHAVPGRNSISPAQMCELTGVEPRSGGPLAAIVLPKPAVQHDQLHLDRLAGEAAEDAIGATLFGGAGPWPTAELWLDPFFEERPRADDTRARCATLAARVPVFACTIGREVLADSRALTDLVDAVLR